MAGPAACHAAGIRSRQHVHRVHQEDPDEHSQCQRRDEFAALGVVDHALGLVLDHFRQDLNGSLKAAGYARSRFAGSSPQHDATDHAQNQGKENRVEVEQTEVNDVGLLDAFK